MTFYNMIHGFNPIMPFLVAMLGDKHFNEYPRFRDAFMGTAEGEPKYDQDIILIYTRVGGNNRNEGFGEEDLYNHPNYIDTYDDEFDATYGNYVFSVPSAFTDDYAKISSGNFQNISDFLKKRCRKMYPEFSEIFDGLWGKCISENVPVFVKHGEGV